MPLDLSCLSDFTIDDDGFITNLGKFEGEPSWVAYFYGCLEEGAIDCSDDSGFCSLKFHLTDEERQAFPDLYFEDFVVIDLSPEGFVYGHYGSLRTA